LVLLVLNHFLRRLTENEDKRYIDIDMYRLKKHLNNTYDLLIIREIIECRKNACDCFLLVHLFMRVGYTWRSIYIPNCIVRYLNRDLIFYANAGGGYDCNWLAKSSALQPGCNRLENRNPVFGGTHDHKSCQPVPRTRRWFLRWF